MISNPNTLPLNESRNEEIMPLEQARFFDTIAPEYEEMWRKLHGAAKETHKSCSDILFPVFADSSLPKIIRDRAGLIALGAWEPKYTYERECWTRNMGFLFGSIDMSGLNENGAVFREKSLTKWIQDIADYELITKTKIVHPARALHWLNSLDKDSAPNPVTRRVITDWVVNIIDTQPSYANEHNYLVSIFNLCCTLYDQESMDEQTFEDIISKIPKESLRLNLEGECETSDWGGSSIGPVQHPSAFTLIGEGLNCRSTFDPDGRFTTWCKNKLLAWTTAQSDLAVQLSDWLSSVDQATGKAFFVNLANTELQKDTGSQDWSIVKWGKELFGNEILVSNMSERITLDKPSESASSKLRDASKVGDAEIRHSILSEILLRRAAARSVNSEKVKSIYLEDSLKTLEKGALEIGDEHLVALAGIERQLFAVAKKARERNDEQRTQERLKEEQQDPDHILRRQGLADFKAAIEDLRVIHVQTA